MQTPSEMIRGILVTEGIGVFAATSGWGIFISKEPLVPDTTITVYDTGGISANPAYLLDFPTIQVRIRGNTGEYLEAYQKIRQVKDTLLGISSQVLNGDTLRSITCLGDIFSLGYDENSRPLLTLNFSLIMEPQTTSETHRVVIS